MKKVEFLYRCAANWKTFFSISTKEDFEMGEEVVMGEKGTPSKDEFFDSDRHPHKFDDEFDHSLLEVVSIK